MQGLKDSKAKKKKKKTNSIFELKVTTWGPVCLSAFCSQNKRRSITQIAHHQSLNISYPYRCRFHPYLL